MPDNKVRLQKFLADAGVASRRKSEELIAQGLVRVNNRTAKIGDSVDPQKDTVTVSGKRVNKAKNLYYILLNKPRGFVTTTDDDLGRKCVTELVSDIKARLYPVGRLDRVSEGALLLTNDGNFANAMMHPSHHVPKTYRVTVRSEIMKSQAEKLASGIELDGRMTAPAEVNILEKSEGRSVVEIVLYEGRNRQIRRMCEAIGLEVSRLKRTAIGSVRLGTLPVGKYRELTEKEVHSLLVISGAVKDKTE
ncbi:MAG: rRNA pseudouridine synthase [Clostridia bacterium]|nr:rRNA pseudouridine synthase [Clostridia bacterium]